MHKGVEIISPDSDLLETSVQESLLRPWPVNATCFSNKIHFLIFLDSWIQTQSPNLQAPHKEGSCISYISRLMPLNCPFFLSTGGKYPRILSIEFPIEKDA